jgi:hypothetical protein
MPQYKPLIRKNSIKRLRRGVCEKSMKLQGQRINVGKKGRVRSGRAEQLCRACLVLNHGCKLVSQFVSYARRSIVGLNQPSPLKWAESAANLPNKPPFSLLEQALFLEPDN